MFTRRHSIAALALTALVLILLCLAHQWRQWKDDARLAAYKAAPEKVREQLSILEEVGREGRGAISAVHYPDAVVDLETGADRGAITLPIRRGTIRTSGQPAYFVLVESSDREFAQEFGAMLSTAVGEIASAAVEDASFDPGGGWTFENDPGLVTRQDSHGSLSAPMPNPTYSPIKHFLWKGRDVFVDAPFLKWGDNAGQEMLIDRGGCDPLIRVNPPGAELVGGGPVGCTEDLPGRPLTRYRGGQLLRLDIADRCDASGCGRATLKLQKAVHSTSLMPYVTIFEASMVWTAEELGIPYVPRLGMASSKGYKATALLIDFANGTTASGEGAYRFQPGVVNYGTREWSTYSPLLRVKCAFVNCEGRETVIDRRRNISLGAVPTPGSRTEKFDPKDPISFDPFGSSAKGTDCSNDFPMRVGPAPIYYEQLAKLVDDHAVEVTNTPCGWTGADLRDYEGDLYRDLVLNAPSPVTVRAQ